MRGHEIEIELGAQQQLRRRLFPQGHPHVVILSCDLHELKTKWTFGGSDWASTYLYTSIEGSNMYSTEQCVDLIIVLFVLLYKQINKWPEKMITELPPILFSHRLWTAQGLMVGSLVPEVFLNFSTSHKTPTRVHRFAALSCGEKSRNTSGTREDGFCYSVN